jgi:hypothetical protein
MKYISLGIKWGLILGVVLVIGTQLLTWLGLGTSTWFPILTYISVVILSMFFIREIIRKNVGKVKILTIVIPLILMMIISRYVFQLYMFIYIHYVDPDWVNITAQNWSYMLAEQGVEADKIENRMSIFRKSYQTLNMFTIEIMFYALSQTILGFVVMAIYNWRVKK